MRATALEVKACDPEVDRDGKFVCQLREAPDEMVERFLLTVRLTSRQKVDWQYVNKMPTIFTTGDVDIVMRVVLDNITDFEGLALYRATDKN